MEKTQILQFRQLLEQMQADLNDHNALGADGQRIVELDQQSIGRLSRMDALQNQAMAKAGQARRDAMHLRIAVALARMDEGEYGYCTDCGEDIPVKRLELDPTIPTCVSCAAG